MKKSKIIFTFNAPWILCFAILSLGALGLGILREVLAHLIAVHNALAQHIAFGTGAVEIAVDGQHRIEKARRLGIQTLPAVVIRMEQHIPFLYEGYDRYVEYWNGKLKDRTEDALRWKRKTTK